MQRFHATASCNDFMQRLHVTISCNESIKRVCVRVSVEVASREHKALGDIQFVKEGLELCVAQYTAETTPATAKVQQPKQDEMDVLMSLDTKVTISKEELNMLEKHFEKVKDDYIHDLAQQIVRQRCGIFVYGDKDLIQKCSDLQHVKDGSATIFFYHPYLHATKAPRGRRSP